jgi:prolipoprotein diacylglyceryltransferase
LKFQFKKDGSVFSFYLFWYGVGRFLIGFLRIEEDDFWILNDGQIMAILFVITSLIFYARLNLSKNSSAVNR